MNKKKIVKILRIIAYISIALVCVLIVLTWNDDYPSSTFLFNTIFPILVFLAIPSFDQPFFRLKWFRQLEISPRVLLRVYPIIASVYIVIMTIIPFSLTDHISDLRNLINRDYSKIDQTGIDVLKDYYSTSSPQEIHIISDNGTQLRILEDAFEIINTDEKYTFFYLPRTGWVMNIVDEYGVSLLKNNINKDGR
jgi:hypothetical protein